MTATGDRHHVTVDDLRRLATVNRDSLFRDAGTLIDTEEGILAVPFRVVSDALIGQSRLQVCRLLYSRIQFIDDGVLTGAKPRTIDGSDLDVRLAVIADGINGTIPPESGGQK
jgi:hypothetical protein